MKEETNTDRADTRSSRDDIRSRDEAKSISSRNSNRQPNKERFKHSVKQEKNQFGERIEGSSLRHRRSRSIDSRSTSKYDNKVGDRRRRSSDKRDDRGEKYSSEHKFDEDKCRVSSTNSDSSDSEYEERHHRMKSKKHKKKSSRSKHNDGDDDRKRSKKKSKKSERSRSRGRR